MGSNGGHKRFGLPRWLLALLVATGLATAGWVVVQRLELERANRSVELVLDYPEAARLAQAVGKPVRYVLAEFRAAGITTLAVNEYTVADYLRGGNVVAVAGRDLVADQALGKPLPPVLAELLRQGRFQPGSVYFVAANLASAREFEAALDRRFEAGTVHRRVVAGRVIWEIAREYEWLLGQNLGLAPDQLRLAARLGLLVAPRWSNLYPELTPERVRTLGAQLPRGLGSVAIFSGKQILGYPGLLGATAALLERGGLHFGLIEFADQDGEEELAKRLDYRIVRVHSITPEEMRKIRPEVAAARDLRAVRERGIRAIYLRPFLTSAQVGQEESSLAFNLEYLRDLRRGLVAAGFSAGRAEPLGHLPAPSWALTLLALGTLAGGVLLLRRYVEAGWAVEAGIMGLGALVALAGARAGYGLVVRQLMALGSAIVWSTLGVLAGRDFLRRGDTAGWIRVVVAFLTATACSLVGAALVVGLLGENRFLVAVARFAGVKLLHVVPLLLVWFALARERLSPADGGRGSDSGLRGWRRLWGDLRRVLAGPVTWEQAWLVLLGAGALAFYLLRTGTYINVPVPGWERAARQTLEEWLVVRPRTKEFLLGHPALVVALFLEAQGLAGARLWPLYVAGAIGQLSLVDTFSHLHTPLSVSAVRTLLGLLLGVAVGLLAYTAWQVVAKAWLRTGRRAGLADGEEGD